MCFISPHLNPVGLKEMNLIDQINKLPKQQVSNQFKNFNPVSIPNIPPLPGLLSQEAPLLLRCECACWVRYVCCQSTPLSSVDNPCFRSDEAPAKSPPARDSVSTSRSSGMLRGGRSVVCDSLRPHGLQPSRLLCPWDFPSNFLLQGTFLIQRSNSYLPCLLHWQMDSLPLSHLGSLFWKGGGF